MRRRSGHGRKFRLYGCGWCRQCLNADTDPRLIEALDLTEQYTDCLITETAFAAAKQRVAATCNDITAHGGRATFHASLAHILSGTMERRHLPGWDPYRNQVHGRRDEPSERLARKLMHFQSDTLRDIFGNPFRPAAFSPEWRTDTAVSLARQMYEAREFSAMPILADALQDAGCDSDDVLNQCRQPGEYVRGCWVVDLVLG